jgi:hypothetical protein
MAVVSFNVRVKHVLKEASELQELQNQDDKKFITWYYRLGTTTIVLSVLTGATLLTQIPNVAFKYVVGSLGILSAVISGLQTFWSLAKRAANCHQNWIDLGAIMQEFEKLDETDPQKEKNFDEVFLRYQNIKKNCE